MKLLSEALLLALALFLVVEDGFSARTIILFVAVLAVIYFTQVAERSALRFSFWFFPVASLVGFALLARDASLLAAAPGLLAVALAIFAAIVFVLAALGNFFLKDRYLWYGIVHTAILLVAFLVFQPLVAASLWWLVPFFFCLFFLFREAFRFFGVREAKRVRAISGALALIAVEVLFVLGFLPLGILNTAAFLTLLFFLARDVMAAHFEGTLDREFMLREATVFVLFTLIIFASSTWTI